MAMTPEGRVKKAIKDIFKRRGAVYCMPATGGFGKSGVSDFLACYKGQFISIEAKAGNNEPTSLQEQWLTDVHNAGGWTRVINEDNIDAVEEILNAIDDGCYTM